jgi:predicted DNA-binding transcriptional regulator YafY
MDRTERIYRIEHLLAQRRHGLSFAHLLATLEVSRATLRRDLAHLRERFHSPIVWDAEARVYRLDKPTDTATPLPGLWFSADEIHALLTVHHLLASLDEGSLLAAHIQPLRERLQALLGDSRSETEQVRRRVRILGLGNRHIELPQFQTIGSALIQRRRLRFTYRARSTDETSQREVSPQRLVHYRDNWYLDAWCHLRKGLRSFSVDAIRHAEQLEQRARDVADETLDSVLGSGYGIFSGSKVQWATLRFTPERARWVAAETWHPRQKARFNRDGSYQLSIPYSNPRELVMDILKYGPDVEVLKPASLRQQVTAQLDATRQRYR